MATYGTQISHVREYYCQYTDQIHKKHKSWHDGTMKFYQLNHKFQLFSIDGGMLLGSTIITNSRRVEYILDANGFNKEEHKIFGQFLVMIDRLQCEYDRDISGKARKTSASYNVKKYIEDVGHPENGNSNPSNTSTPVVRHNDSLALKFNKPFRRPLAKRPQNKVPVKQRALTSSKPVYNEKGLELNTPVLKNEKSYSTIENAPVSLTIDMSGSKKSIRASRFHSGNQDQTEQLLDLKVTSKLNKKCPNHKLQRQLSLPETKPIEPISPTLRAATQFRVHRKSILLKHDPIVLGKRHSINK
ncbi:Mte1p LALA0_S08e07712g [Lachancea lanzarotensis]|uniref:LALA0S08e07712g1_1 n=1 Tax=Lachancea lanzarotensis TaxID=1245769 RepID=A0A0C7MUX3_9SACH|nr:uncharacterized protein LALA0_S08e07712g [Lachancea lanzarotensis]CEP63661.1 LALA0S08e07712g1_1 [Lachancea lanzarotensis]